MAVVYLELKIDNFFGAITYPMLRSWLVDAYFATFKNPPNNKLRFALDTRLANIMRKL